MKYPLILTCEHAGNQVPEVYKSLFKGQSEILASHRGWDPGAWSIANYLSKELEVPLFGCLTTRLLIEANRAPNSEQLFSEFTSTLTSEKKEILIQTIYKPYRERVQSAIENSPKPVWHLSIHSFTPVWNNQERKIDIGILFDPTRNSELQFSQQLKDTLRIYLPESQLLFNEPYKGTDDGFTTWLRQRYDDTEYAGIEIEVNQKYAPHLSAVQEALAQSIKAIMNKYTNQHQ